MSTQLITSVPLAEDSATAVITLVHPMPGFPDATRFDFVRLDETGVLAELRSLDQPGLKFLTVPSAVFRPDYAPEIDDETAAELGLGGGSGAEVIVLLIVHAGSTLATTTVNLRAPMIVNTTEGHAAQVILDDQELAVDAPLIP